MEEFLKTKKLEKVSSSQRSIAEKHPALKMFSSGDSRVGEPRHPDFEKIYRQFMKRYCGSPNDECEEGKRAYYAWLNMHSLDDTKPYRKPQEAFRWAKPTIELTKEDPEAKYYKVEALFPVSSMNNNLYSEDELLRAARTLIGKPVNMNHESPPLEGVKIIDAEFEDGAVEALLQVSRNAEFNGKKIIDMIENGEIIHVSIEGSCRSRKMQSVNGESGFSCEGLVLTSLALLQNEVLPGIPLTRIKPVEKIIEEFMAEEDKAMNRGKSMIAEKDSIEKNKVEKMEAAKYLMEREWDTAFINSLPDAAFAVIEPAYLRGETKDKRCRHLPHHGPKVKDSDENGSVDLPHLRNALARCDQIKPVTDSISAEELREEARRHLERHAKALLKTYQKDGEPKEKSPRETAKESILKRLREIERQTRKLLLLEDRVKNLEKLYEKMATDGKERSEDKPLNIMTKEKFWERFRQLRSEGLSKSDAYRLTALEFLEALARKKRLG